jgi:predicted nucleotidyltransferase
LISSNPDFPRFLGTVEKKQDEAYKQLFAELKELLESDLELEKEIMENHKIVANDIVALKEEILKLRRRLRRKRRE